LDEMRVAFIQCKYKYQARKAYPWTAKTTKVCGGYKCFESWDDYKTWKNQK